LSQEIEGSFNISGQNIAIIGARFNEAITLRLVKGAIEALQSSGMDMEAIKIFWVPGSFEIPLIAKSLALSKRFNAIICLGAVIKKETAHFEYVSAQMAGGIASVSLETTTPVIFGVLTTYDYSQALERSGGSQGNRGYDAALAAIQMSNILKEIGHTYPES
jgi:6,7-dimethyl-8-ribityllumazine synthase